MVSPPRRGVLGGTFNPIHIGHLLAAEEARTALGLNAVIFVPAGEPWMRTQEDLAPKEDRWEMVLRAVESNPHFAASRVDLDRAGPSFAVDTLKDLLFGKPGPGLYWFIMGGDTLMGLPRWKDPERLLRLCRLAVVSRPGNDVTERVAAIAKEMPFLADRIDVVAGLAVDISATDIRERVRAGRSIKYRVSEEVESYIMERSLYQGKALDP